MSRQYIGARYVIKIYENKTNPSLANWDIDTNYEPLTLVTYNYGSYLSKKEVPATIGNPAENPTYWAQTGFYNGQIGNLENEINKLIAEDATLRTAINNEVSARMSKDAELNGKIDNALSRINVETTARETADSDLTNAIDSVNSTLSTAINNEISTRSNADTLINARIDQIISPTGEAPSAEEVADARIGFNGTTYLNLGGAIRSQIGDIYYADGANGGLSISFKQGNINSSGVISDGNASGFYSNLFMPKCNKYLLYNIHSMDVDSTDYYRCVMYEYDENNTFVASKTYNATKNEVVFNTAHQYRFLFKHIVNGSAASVDYSTDANKLNYFSLVPYNLALVEFNNLIPFVRYQWEDGDVDSTTGENEASNTRVRTGFIYFAEDATITVRNKMPASDDADDYMQFKIMVYDNLQAYDHDLSQRTWQTGDFNYDVKGGYYYKLVLGHRTSGSNAQIHVATDMTYINKVTIIKGEYKASEIKGIHDEITANSNDITKLANSIKNRHALVGSYAHQGYREHYTPNTVGAIIAAAEHGFVGCQFNVRPTADKVAVLQHDDEIYVNPNTYKITSVHDEEAVPYLISEHTYADLSQYTYYNLYDQTQKVPTLDEALEACKTHGIIPYILSGGMTPQSYLESVVGTINKYALNNQCIISGNWGRQVYTQGLIPNPKLEYVVSSFPDINDDIVSPNGTYHYLYEHAQAGGQAGFNIQLSSYTLGTREQDIAYLKQLHGIGLQVTVGVLEDTSDYALLAPHADRVLSNTLMYSDVF